MKGEKVREFFRKTGVKIGSIVLAAAVLAGSSAWYENTQLITPELVTYVDSDESVSISEDEVPLATPKVTTSTKTKKTTKNVKMKTAAKKTYTKTNATKKKTTTKKTSTAAATTTTKTVTATTVSNKYTKKSKIRKQTTTVKTTVTKTVVAKTTATTANGTVKIATAAPKVDTKVSSAFEQLGFKIVVNSGVSYSGLFDARSQTITLKKADATVYHELGHFVAFAAGNADTTAAFQKVFAAEKAKYTAYNKAYVLSNSSEYFAESFKNYVENPSALKSARPQTYAAIESAINSLTSAQIKKIAAVYKSVWS